MPSLMRRVPAGILATAIALSAAACGSAASIGSAVPGQPGTPATPATSSPLAGLTPDQIVHQAADNLLAVTSVRISGKVVSQGMTTAFDFADGIEQSCTGTVAVTPSASSASAAAAAIIEANGTVFVKYAASYLESLHPTASQFAELNGKYISTAPSSKLGAIAQICDVPYVVSLFNQDDAGYVSAGTATIDGQPALAFKQVQATTSDIVYVLDYPIPEILGIKLLDNADAYVDFSDIDAPFSVESPPASEVISASRVGLNPEQSASPVTL